ncbi:hypothetical protein H4R18_005895 [Coemansia javaensis]|uniref:F-box domain-containing protein n=1 Tax=Coemansia javaensis TaxID=2761396 RepID=A0A9W8H0B2_9FUNG|nr:hypothetical protein H4R18_005895 [Coemansia javaensis]
MYIGDVPHDVVSLILQRAATPESGGLAHWKRTLALLSVCRSWRDLARPFVFRDLIIIGSDDGRDGAGRSVALASNAQLVVASRSARYVRSVSISLAPVTDATALVNAAIGQLCIGDTVWARAQSLLINIGLHDSMGRVAASDGQSAAIAAGMATRIRAALPGISRIRLDGGGSVLTRRLGGVLCDVYAPQLTRLVSHYRIPLSVPEFSAQLTHLEMVIGGDAAAQVPRVHASSLRSLALHLFPNGYSWTPFLGAGEGPDIVFPHLESLDVSYGPSHDAPGAGPARAARAPRLRFPRLGRLAIFGSHAGCAILSAGVFPQRMRAISLFGAAHAAVLLGDSALCSVEGLALTAVSVDGCSSAAFMRATNRLFSASCSTRAAALTLCESVALVDPAQIAWQGLAKLTISDGAEAGVLLAIIKAAPSLVELAAFHIRIDAEQDIPADGAALEAGGSGIEKLFLSCAPHANSARDGAQFAVCLLAGLCCLRTAILVGAHRGQVRSLVDSYSSRFGHLAHMSIGYQ